MPSISFHDINEYLVCLTCWWVIISLLGYLLSFDMCIHTNLNATCRLGPMVAMLRNSAVATYSVSLPPQKLEFSSSIKGDLLKRETDDV